MSVAEALKGLELLQYSFENIARNKAIWGLQKSKEKAKKAIEAFKAIEKKEELRLKEEGLNKRSAEATLRTRISSGPAYGQLALAEKHDKVKEEMAIDIESNPENPLYGTSEGKALIVTLKSGTNLTDSFRESFTPGKISKAKMVGATKELLALPEDVKAKIKTSTGLDVTDGDPKHFFPLINAAIEASKTDPKVHASLLKSIQVYEIAAKSIAYQDNLNKQFAPKNPVQYLIKNGAKAIPIINGVLENFGIDAKAIERDKKGRKVRNDLKASDWIGAIKDWQDSYPGRNTSEVEKAIIDALTEEYSNDFSDLPTAIRAASQTYSAFKANGGFGMSQPISIFVNAADMVRLAPNVVTENEDGTTTTTDAVQDILNQASNEDPIMEEPIMEEEVIEE